MFRRLSALATTVALTAGALTATVATSQATSPAASTASPYSTAAVLAAPKSDKKKPGKKSAKRKPDPAYVPPVGPVFNNPVGKSRARLVKRVIDAVDNTPAGAQIHIAAYSFDRKDVADALLRAYKRGVAVQLVINDNWTSDQTRRLQRKFGHKLNAPSSLRICHRSCRGGPGNLHMKVYAFSQTGAAKNVIITGAANMTDRAVNLQWNDLFTLNNVDGLYRTFLGVYSQLKRDKPVRPRRVLYSSGNVDATFYRKNPGTVTSAPLSARLPGPAQDPVMQRLQSLNCNTVAGYGNAAHKTVIRIQMYGWNGKRGVWLAEEMAALKKKGCDIRATLSLGGGNVVKILGAARIPIQSTDWKYLSDGTVDFYNHMKVLTINGTLAGKPTRSVWTGSENWSGMSFRNDELILQINDNATYLKYYKRFNTMWKSRVSHSFGFHPTGKP